MARCRQTPRVSTPRYSLAEAGQHRSHSDSDNAFSEDMHDPPTQDGCEGANDEACQPSFHSPEGTAPSRSNDDGAESDLDHDWATPPGTTIHPHDVSPLWGTPPGIPNTTAHESDLGPHAAAPATTAHESDSCPHAAAPASTNTHAHELDLGPHAAAPASTNHHAHESDLVPHAAAPASTNTHAHESDLGPHAAAPASTNTNAHESDLGPHATAPATTANETGPHAAAPASTNTHAHEPDLGPHVVVPAGANIFVHDANWAAIASSQRLRDTGEMRQAHENWAPALPARKPSPFLTPPRTGLPEGEGEDPCTTVGIRRDHAGTDSQASDRTFDRNVDDGCWDNPLPSMQDCDVSYGLHPLDSAYDRELEALIERGVFDEEPHTMNDGAPYSELDAGAYDLHVGMVLIDPPRLDPSMVARARSLAEDGRTISTSDVFADATRLLEQTSTASALIHGIELSEATAPQLSGPASTTPTLVKNIGKPETADPQDTFTCADCRETFDTKTAMKTHQRKYHCDPVQRGVEVMGMLLAVDVERQTRHGPGGPTTAFWCPRCNCPFPLPGNLRRHCKSCKGSGGLNHRLYNPEPLEKPDGVPRVTGRLLRKIAALDITEAYPVPKATQMTPWAKRSGHATLLKGQNLSKYAALVTVDRATATDNDTLSKDMGMVTREGISQSLTKAWDRLEKCGTYYKQAMNARDTGNCGAVKPMSLKESSLKDCIRIWEKLVVGLVRTHIKLYGADPDYDAYSETQTNGELPSPLEEGLETVIRALFRADATVKAAVNDIIATGAEEAYWRLGSCLLTAPLPDNPTESVLLVLLAAISIRTPVDGNFASAKDFSPILSRVISALKLSWFMAEMVRIDGIMSERLNQMDDHAQTTSEAGYRATLFRATHHTFLGAGSLFNSAFNELLSQRNFGMAAAKGEGVKGRTSWAEDGQSLMIDGHNIHKSSIRKLMTDSIAGVVETLQVMLKFSTLQLDLNSVPLERMTDNPAWDDVGAWFGIHSGNPKLFDLNAYQDDIYRKFVVFTPSTAEIPWKPKIDASYAKILKDSEADFLTALRLAIYLTSGVPPRGTELNEATMKNGAGTRLRSFFLGTGGEVILDLTYSKMEHTATRSQQNLRYLHPTVGKAVALYACTIRPLMDTLYLLEHRQERVYMWNIPDVEEERGSDKWATDSLSRELGYRSTAAGVGMEFGVNSFRQFAEAVIHAHFRSGPLRNLIDGLLADAGDNDTDFDQIEEAAHLAEASMRNKSEKGKGRTMVNDTHDAYAAQSGRTLRTSYARYGVDTTLRRGMDQAVLCEARLVSRTWQGHWGLLMPATSGGTSSWSSDSESPSASFASEESVLHSPSSASTTAGGRTSTPSVASYTSGEGASKQRAATGRIPLTVEQTMNLMVLMRGRPNFVGLKSDAIADALPLMLNDVTHLAAVARTGGGKSLFWQMSAMEKPHHPTVSSITIVVIPYNALIKDVERVAEQLGLSHARWEENEFDTSTDGNPALLLISLNKAVSQPFLTWLSDPTNRSRISRVIVDEAHVLIDEQFRQCVKRFANLTTLLSNKKFIFTSATIPPKKEKDLLDLTLLDIIFKRELTHRTNIAYQIRRYSNRKDAAAKIRDKVNVVLEQDKNAQALVVARGRDDAKEYAAALGCAYYVSEKSDNEPDVSGKNDADRHLEDFLCGRTRLIVGTTAVSVGIDLPRVKYAAVIDPWSTVSFNQAAGRLGRDGTDAEADIYLRGDQVRFPPSNTVPSTDQEALQMLLSETVCLRIPLGSWIDGRAASCIELGAKRCGVCVRLYGVATILEPEINDATGKDDGQHIRAEEAVQRREGEVPTQRASTDIEVQKQTVHAIDKTKDVAAQHGCGSVIPPTENPQDNIKIERPFITANEKRKADEALRSTVGKYRKVVYSKSARPKETVAPSPPIPAAPRPEWPMDSDEEQEMPMASGATALTSTSGIVPETPSPPSSGRLPHTPGPDEVPVARIGNSTIIGGITNYTQRRAAKQEGLKSKGGRRGDTDMSSSETIKWFNDRSVNGFGIAAPPSKTVPASWTPTPLAGPSRLMNQGGAAVRTGACSTEVGIFSHIEPKNLPFTCRIPEVDKKKAAQMSTAAAWIRAIHTALKQTENRCPMCTLLGRPAGHTAEMCRMPSLDIPAQITFRKDTTHNSWFYGAACFKCNLPQDVCGRRNADVTCEFAKYKDTVRSILMFLTAYSDAMDAAMEVAEVINPFYELSRATVPLQMGDGWRDVEIHNGLQEYRAFQAVVAILLIFSRQV
ncbi:hypothetical protein CF319_g7855 [Tilletia indica]|nr:hypothetical protein CF319_g7855 [Tilletia indica]